MYIMRYDKKLIYDYIMGNDIDGISLEELEDNVDFMREVIVKTNDPKMYYLCSDRLKIDFRFLVFLIERYIEQETTINNIVLNYFKNIHDEVKRRELEIILGELSFKYSENNYLKKYQNLLINTYVTEMNEYKYIISKMSDFQKRKYFGTGFFFVLDRYGSSKIINDFYAKSIMKDILLDFDLESDLHEKFKNPYDLTKYGVNTYILEVIKNYDIHLKNYLSANTNLLDKALAMLFIYLNRWNKYNSSITNDVLKKIDDYVSNNENISLSFRKKLLCFIREKLKYQVKENENNSCQSKFSLLIGNLKNYELINGYNLTIPEMITIIEVEKIISENVLVRKIMDVNTKKLIKVDFDSTD